MAEVNDDIQIDTEADLDDSVVAEEHQGDAVKKLREKLKLAEEKAKEYLDQLQRAKADFVNMRKRDEDAKQEFVKFAKSDVLSELMPILDSFNLAMSHGEKGVEPIYKQFIQILKQHELEEVNPLHEMFDPKHHEAIGFVPTENSEEDNQILEVLSKGYILSGKTLRPAKVRIGEYKINRY
ncbi:MAG: nucleotide exchange factor GrpE [Patescibacteria group bacterium]